MAGGINAKFEPVKPGDPLSAAQYNAALAEIERLSRFNAESGGESVSTGAGVFRKRNNDEGVLIGKANAAIGIGSFGEVTVYTGPKGEEIATARVELVYNRFVSVQSGRWCQFRIVDGDYEMIQPECPAA